MRSGKARIGRARKPGDLPPTTKPETLVERGGSSPCTSSSPAWRPVSSMLVAAPAALGGERHRSGSKGPRTHWCRGPTVGDDRGGVHQGRRSRRIRARATAPAARSRPRPRATGTARWAAPAATTWSRRSRARRTLAGRLARHLLVVLGELPVRVRRCLRDADAGRRRGPALPGLLRRRLRRRPDAAADHVGAGVGGGRQGLRRARRAVRDGRPEFSRHQERRGGRGGGRGRASASPRAPTASLT